MKLEELENMIEGTILREKDKITKARDLENSLVAAWNGEEPDSFQQLSKAITDALKPQIKGTAEMVATQPITKRWIKYGGADKTPKADIRLGKYPTSLKMGAGQFMSGQKGETTATLLCSLEDSGIYNTKGFTQEVVAELDKLENKLIFESTTGALKGAVLKKQKADPSIELLGDEKLMEERLTIQRNVQEYFNQITDVETNPEVKYYFLREAMTGIAKFGKDSPATAKSLLSVASVDTLYGKKTKSSRKRGVVSVDSSFETIEDFYDFSMINSSSIKKYMPLVNLSVKFKSDSLKDAEGNNIGTKAREVVGLLFDELDKFKKSLNSTLETIAESENSYLNEEMLDKIRSGLMSFKDFLNKIPSTIASKIQNLYRIFVEKIKNAFNVIKMAIIDIARRGVDAVLKFFNLTPIVRFEDEINFSSVAVSANESLTKSKITYKMLEQMVEEAIKKAR